MAKILKERPASQTTTRRHPLQLGQWREQPALEVSRLTKSYAGKGKKAVDDLSFIVQPGEIFGLLGPNGAGKTTTIGVLTTRVIPTSGTVCILGMDVVADPMKVKQSISIVPQFANLDRSLRAREVLTYHARYHGMPRAESETRADLLLRELGLEKREKESVAKFSGGMAQRLLLARALMHSPRVLFLDEPTRNLDPQSRLFIWERIRELNKRGVTVLLTTHDMDEADLLCNRIAIMDQGRMLALDTGAALKKLIPGGGTLRVQAHIPQIAATHAALLQQSGEQLRTCLSLLPGVTKVEEMALTNEPQQPGSYLFSIYAEDGAALVLPVAQSIVSSGGQIRDLQVVHPGLEDVFIYLTGRNLRS